MSGKPPGIDVLGLRDEDRASMEAEEGVDAAVVEEAEAAHLIAR